MEKLIERLTLIVFVHGFRLGSMFMILCPEARRKAAEHTRNRQVCFVVAVVRRWVVDNRLAGRERAHVSTPEVSMQYNWFYIFQARGIQENGKLLGLSAYTPKRT